MDWNSSMRSSRLRVAPVVVPVVLWSLLLFRSAESRGIMTMLIIFQIAQMQVFLIITLHLDPSISE
jgi:hypothetical protein